ncbi:NF-kappa-B inhibitor alpha-like [Saccostrea cucullata]|uniref:NF-kappa-B inhibitor alpha-like n=1 Tax=Saccostrea cuccullata TaxID=36930 RepID=UPI002ED465C3
MDEGSRSFHELPDQSLETDGGVCESLSGIQTDHTLIYFSAPRSGGIPLHSQNPSTSDSQSFNVQALESPEKDHRSFSCNASSKQRFRVSETTKEGQNSHQFSTIADDNHAETGVEIPYAISYPNIQKMLRSDDELHMTIIDGLVPVAEYILKSLSGVNADLLNIQNNDLQTPLSLAVHENHVKVVFALIKNGASLLIVDKNGNTPLHIACIYGFDRIVCLLLENVERKIIKKCISIPNYFGQSCIHLAVDRMHFSVMRLLLKHGADVNDREKLFGMTILHKAAKTGNKQLLEYLLTLQGLDLNSKTFDGLTAIFLAYFENQHDILHLLGQAGCNLFHKF